MTKKRIEWLDIAKGICILLVVLGHELTWDEELRYLIYAFHIPMFFILSGMTAYITKETEKNFKDFFVKNVNALFKPYIMVSFCYILFDIVWGGVQRRFSARIVIYDLYQTLVCYGINVLWFIITLFLAKIILYWILKIKKNGIIKFVVLCIVGIVLIDLASVLTGTVKNTQLQNPIMWLFIGIFRPFLAVAFVYMGFILYPVIYKMLSEKDNAEFRTFLYSFCTLVVLIPAFFKMKITMVNMISEPAWMIMVSGMIGSLGMINVSIMFERVPVLKRILSFFGRNSLIIMLTHEYLQVRSSIQTICEGIIGNHVMALIVTFTGVLVVETIICFLWPYYKKLITKAKNYIR